MLLSGCHCVVELCPPIVVKCSKNWWEIWRCVFGVILAHVGHILAGFPAAGEHAERSQVLSAAVGMRRGRLARRLPVSVSVADWLGGWL